VTEDTTLDTTIHSPSMTADHVGHADLLREGVDGLVGEDPPQP
jgi:hypothetical protein